MKQTPIAVALSAARSWLRSQVTASIHRKHCPTLLFQVRPQSGGEA